MLARRAQSPLWSLFDEMDRMLPRLTPRTAAADSAEFASFAVNIGENEGSYVIQAQVPGFTKEQLTVHYDDGQLSISGKSNVTLPEGTNTLWKEIRDTEYRRSITLQGIDPETISAKLENGVLTVTAPKLEVRKPRAIPVDA